MSKTRIPYVLNDDGTPGEAWNPITGCTPVDEGCRNCWAQKYLERFGQLKEIYLHKERITQPLGWKKSRTVAVCFMGDLFHEDIKFNDRMFLCQILEMIEKTPQHRYLLLTKRIERMKEFINFCFQETSKTDNIWLGVTVTNQKTADERIPILLSIPAVHHWVSYEPALDFVDFSPFLYYSDNIENRTQKISLIVMGAESGHGARPMNIEWARSVRDQCIEVAIPFYYKQGDGDDGQWTHMPVLDGKIWNQIPWIKENNNG